MILRFGTYRHDDCEIKLGIRAQTQFSAARIPYLYTETWILDGLLVGSDVADITTKINALKAAYNQRNVDAELLTTDGATTAHRLLHAQTIGGVRVITPPEFPEGSGAEYTTWRTYTVVLEADFPVGPGQQILEWTETIENSGGGPLWMYTQPIAGEPIRQTVRQQTTFKATQSGTAVGFRSRPIPPPPLWPGAIIEGPRILQVSPRRNGTALQEFGISWQYNFESAYPLLGTPNPPPE